MKKFFVYATLGIVLVCTLYACKKDKEPSIDADIYKASDDINPTVNSFRQLLGTLNTTPGATGGRREVNWDGVPDTLMGKRLPDNFFNSTEPGANPARQKGLVYDPGTGEFRVSNTNFADIDPQAAAQFTAFSGNNTFANVTSNLWPVGFNVAGQTKTASVQGFGAVFLDVDLPNSTTIEFFENNVSLGKYFVPAHGNTSNFSFLGVFFKNRKITKVQIAHQGLLINGEKDITTGGTNDLVLLDDFIYSEPVAISQ